jgi:hypothetical protein
MPPIDSEPGVRRLVVQMGGIEQGHQNVHVEQSDHAARLSFVPEPVNNFRCNEAGLSPGRQDRHAVAFAWGTAARSQSTAGELGKNPPCGSSTPRRQFLGGLKHVFVDVQCGSHGLIITHQSSDVNDANYGRMRAPAATLSAAPMLT